MSSDENTDRPSTSLIHPTDFCWSSDVVKSTPLFGSILGRVFLDDKALRNEETQGRSHLYSTVEAIDISILQRCFLKTVFAENGMLYVLLYLN